MKKIVVFFIIVAIILVWISCMYFDYIRTYNQAKIENQQFDSYLNHEIGVSDLTTIINRAVDSNEKNEIKKNEKGKYISNDTNSINIDIKMLDYDKTYYMEMFYNNGMTKFVQAYTGIKFKCTDVEYHTKTRKSKIYVI